jgi:hypothetical protein
MDWECEPARDQDYVLFIVASTCAGHTHYNEDWRPRVSLLRQEARAGAYPIEWSGVRAGIGGIR